MVDYHLVMDLIPTVARIFFLKQLGDVSLSAAQCVSLAGFCFVCQGMEEKVLPRRFWIRCPTPPLPL